MAFGETLNNYRINGHRIEMSFKMMHEGHGFSSFNCECGWSCSAGAIFDIEPDRRVLPFISAQDHLTEVAVALLSIVEVG